MFVSKEVRETFHQTVTLQKSIHMPHYEALGFWEETINRWHREGLPEDQSHWEYFGIDQFMDNAPSSIGRVIDLVDEPPFWPRFKTEIIEEKEDYIIEQGRDSIIKKNKKDRVSMPQFLKFPVENRKDWERIKWRLNPDTEERIKRIKEAAPSLKQREYILRFGICGCYGFPRSLFGEEKLSYLFYDEPKLLHEIMAHWLSLYTGIADHICPLVDFDYVFIWEDMGFKTSSLISPKLFREFMFPYLKDFISHMRKVHHLDLFMVDSDGNNLPVLPLFMEAGVNIFMPCEIAAGMEPLILKEKFPNLVPIGGIDKREIAKGNKAIEKEIMKKVPSLLEKGGYIPSLDHGVPSDISFENFCYYLEFLRKVAGAFYKADN